MFQQVVHSQRLLREGRTIGLTGRCGSNGRLPARCRPLTRSLRSCHRRYVAGICWELLVCAGEVASTSTYREAV
jgi:hypothetical protein